MKHLLRIISGAFLGTSAMTLWSNGVAHLDGRQHSEPALLNKFLNKKLHASTKEKNTAGWAIHYTVGCLFVAAYDLLWRTRRVRESVKYDVVIGIASGLIGAAAWSAVHRIAPEIKALKKQSYYLQLVPAHVVFSCVAAAVYRLLRENSLQCPGSSLKQIDKR